MNMEPAGSSRLERAISRGHEIRAKLVCLNTILAAGLSRHLPY